ncbi:MAG: class I SAM-dependent methyltransferase [Solirubrobacterales bacterium]
MGRRRVSRVSGERVSTRAGGFNPTWQRHVAAYELCAPLLPEGAVVDLGCGIGHSFARLAPRRTVGVDLDPAVLRGQERETVVADMRALPFPDASFAGAIAVQSLEHVPDPGRALAEAARVLSEDGVAVFVTPNHLTFGHEGEVIDPYHHLEFTEPELRDAAALHFGRVEMLGLFGSPRYLALVAREREELERLLRWDRFGLRRRLPLSLRRQLYDLTLRRRRAGADPAAEAIESGDFELRPPPLQTALDLVAVCRQPRRRESAQRRR